MSAGRVRGAPFAVSLGPHSDAGRAEPAGEPTAYRFTLGRVIATPGALAACDAAGVTAGDCLRRHLLGEWGDVGAADAADNERAVVEGGTLASAYVLPAGGGASGASAAVVFVITAADRGRTTVLLAPREWARG